MSLENAHRNDLQENATHIVTVSFVVVPMFVFVLVRVIMIARAVSKRLHSMVVVVVVIMLQSAG